LLKRALAELGKSLLIVAGVSYGIVKAFDALASNREPSHPHPTPASDLPPEQKTTTERPMTSADRKTAPATAGYSVPPPVSEEKWSRLDLVEERLIRMEKRIEVLIAPLERLTARPANVDNFVTKAEFHAAMEQFSRRIEDETERRFEVQDRSVQSLRTMMARTDELLEQVIENIESMRISV
jgi:hypothetical protein